MKLISFLAIPLLAIAVSAQPPHNPDTQNTNPFPDDDIQEMDQSQNDAAQDIPYFLDSDFEMLESILGSVAQTMNQPQGVSAQDGVQSTSAATWNAQSPLGSTSQDMHQYPGSSSQSAQQPQGISAQDMYQYPGSSSQSAPSSLDSTSQDIHQYPGSSSQSTQQPQGISAQNRKKSTRAAPQSAQQPQEGTSAKNRKKSTRAAPQSDQVVDKSKIRTERDKLKRYVKIQDNMLLEINSHINAEKKRIIGVNGMIEAVGIKLQDISLSSDKKPELQEKSRELRILANELGFRQSEHHQSRIDITTKRRNANAALQVFQKNRDLIAKHNFDNEVKVGFSPNSLYSMEILTTQYDEALEDLEKLRAEQKKISDAISVPDDVASKAQIERLENEIQDLKSYSRISGAILWAYKHTQPIGAWIPTSLDSYVQDFQI
ncbi:hypothetical protein BASA61_010022 [Batrachochytrium salamandrivorans]|nr:hypothetical protein BASA61_010022 [Batrachochytrium salamandrivorans]